MPSCLSILCPLFSYFSTQFLKSLQSQLLIVLEYFENLHQEGGRTEEMLETSHEKTPVFVFHMKTNVHLVVKKSSYCRGSMRDTPIMPWERSHSSGWPV